MNALQYNSTFILFQSIYKRLLESLLTFYIGKNSTKKKKVKQVLNTISYNPYTKEFYCKSVTNPEREYIVIYSHSSQQYFCNCPAKIYQEYRMFNSPEDKYRLGKKMECIHIISSRIYKNLNHLEFG